MESKYKIEMAKWALLSCLVVISVFSVRYAVGQSSQTDPRKHAERSIDSITYTLDAGVPQGNDIPYSISVKNDGKSAVNLDLNVRLVKTTFKGNPLSRVVSPGDSTVENISSKSFRKTLSAGKAWQFKYAIQQPSTNNSPKDTSRVYYSIQIASENKPLVGLPIVINKSNIE